MARPEVGVLGSSCLREVLLVLDEFGASQAIEQLEHTEDKISSLLQHS